jgi:hypothetical protein
MAEHEPQPTCEKCGQPRGAHAADCPVLAENIEEVKKEYDDLQKQGAEHHKREGVPEPGTTFEEQMQDVNKNLHRQQEKAYESAEGLTEQFKADVRSGKITWADQEKEIAEYLKLVLGVPAPSTAQETKPISVQETELEKKTRTIDDEVEMTRAKALECWRQIENLAPSNEQKEIYYEFINTVKKLEKLESPGLNEENIREYLGNCDQELNEIHEKINKLLNKTSK